ncbi:MAG: protein rhiA [Acidobacteriota bacterium]
MANGVPYQLIFKNESTQFGSACVYQQDPDVTDPDVMSLAWFCKSTAPTTTVDFDWSIDYNFVWSRTGALAPGVIFRASQVWDANLSTTNQVTLTKMNDAYTFKDQRQGARHGTLYVDQDNLVAPQELSVGVGMSGFGTFVVQGQPNVTAMFTPHPEYWITFGKFQQGEVLDITQITNAAQIKFPPNVYSMTATLGSDNMWTIAPTE